MQETWSVGHKGETVTSGWLVGEGFLEEVPVKLSLVERSGRGGITERAF